MPRYDEMDDLLRRVRDRLVDADPEAQPEAAQPWLSVAAQEDQCERVLACTQALMRDAELLRELVAGEHLHALSAVQHEHVLSVLSSVMQELWSSEVTLRRAELHD